MLNGFSPNALEFLERLGDRKFCQELCRWLEYLKHRKRTRETKASNFGVLVSAKYLLGRRADKNRRATGRQPLPKVTNTTQKSPAGRFCLPT